MKKIDLINQKFGKLTVIKQSAKKRNIGYSLDKEEFKQLIFNSCHYCGTKPQNIRQNNSMHKPEQILCNGIDRVNNDLGYETSNCVTACFICNQAKHQLTQEVFLKWVDRIYNHNFSGLI